MKTIAAATLIASSFTPIAFPPLVAPAAAESVDGSYCNLSREQVLDGWTCEARTDSVSRPSSFGNSDVEGGLVVLIGIDPNGNEDSWHTYTGATLTDDGLLLNFVFHAQPFKQPPERDCARCP